MMHVTYHEGGFKVGAPSQNKSQQWDAETRLYTSWDVAGAQTDQRAFTASENVIADALVAVEQRDANEGTLTAQGIAAIEANISWVASVLPQIQTAVDAMQAKAAIAGGTAAGGFPTKAETTAALTSTSVSALATATATRLGQIYDLILLPLVLQVRDLSLSVETLAAERKRSSEIEVALMRLVLQQLDSTEGAS